jgi:hypothetical protein
MPVPPYTSEETAASARLGKASVCPRKAGARTRPRLVPCRRLAGGGADDRLQAEAAVTNPGEIRIPTRDTTIFRRGPASLGGIVTVRKVRHLCARTGAGWISAIAVVPHGFGNGDALSAQGQRPALGLWVRSTAPACRQRPEQDDDRTLPRTAAPDTATGGRYARAASGRWRCASQPSWWPRSLSEDVPITSGFSLRVVTAGPVSGHRAAAPPKSWCPDPAGC